MGPLTIQFAVNKTSLDFICSPISASPNPPVNLRSLIEPRISSRSPLECLPRDNLALIAFHLSVDASGIGRHPAPLIPLFLTSRAIYNAISFDNNPQLYNSLFRATFDHTALSRRYNWLIEHVADVAGRGRNVFDLFSDPRSWAIEYKTRWELAWRMRQVSKHGRIDLPGICDKKQLSADLWNIWFLLTENDGKNVPFLAKQCAFEAWTVVYYKEDLLKESLVPGYPKETGEKALGVWCTLLSRTDLASESTPAEVDEKIFVLRPYVFACARYDVTYAPWHHRRLPLGDHPCKEQESDVTLRSKSLQYSRFGQMWRRAPPHAILGCYLLFLRLLERQTSRMGLERSRSTFSLAPSDVALPGLFSTTRDLPSLYHDRDWQRNSVCHDPHTSPGLPPLTFRGELQGFWRGKFLMIDFDHYRQILAGDMRGVYTGAFSEQVAEMELRETVVKIRLEEVGGSGPIMNAGYDDEEDDGSPEELRGVENGALPKIVNENEPDDPGWTKEILLSGKCRTSWGLARVKGRVRAWDGLVVLALSYSREVMGRWLWRGYLHTGGYLVGRWRDTFTAEHLRGYEGAFGMVRAGDIFYPSHFPTRMADSLGVNDSGITGQTKGRLSAEYWSDPKPETAQAEGEIEKDFLVDVKGSGSAEGRDDTRQDSSQDVWPRSRMSRESAVREEPRSTSWSPGVGKRKARSESYS